MNIKQLQSECQQLLDRECQLRKARERQWFLGDVLVNLTISPYIGDGYGGIRSGDEVTISYGKLQADATAHCTLENGLRISGGFFHFDYGHLRGLTSDQLRRIGLCVSVFERYLAGELEELPASPPDGAVVPPPSFLTFNSER